MKGTNLYSLLFELYNYKCSIYIWKQFVAAVVLQFIWVRDLNVKIIHSKQFKEFTHYYYLVNMKVRYVEYIYVYKEVFLWKETNCS